MNVREIATAVAAELGDGWTAAPGIWDNGSDAYLDGPDVRLHLHESRYYAQRGRLAISGSLTPEQHARHHSYTDGPVPEITVSPDKAARLIAGDIRRRLLGTLRPLIDKLNDRVHAHQAAERARDAQMKALASLIPGAYVPERNPAHIDFGLYDDGGDIDVLYGGDIKFELRFSADKATKLAEFLGRLQRGEA